MVRYGSVMDPTPESFPVDDANLTFEGMVPLIVASAVVDVPPPGDGLETVNAAAPGRAISAEVIATVS
jgi:hypothetical protein